MYMSVLGPAGANGCQYFETSIWRARNGMLNLSSRVALKSSPVSGASVRGECPIYFDDISIQTSASNGQLINNGQV
ncbi:hypothetical protein PG994_013762 [Apiospora phragmitis]|uniref:Uncharacterized protein n=1 Tax=Apiospora phragmitis TaxID=2905665 RepID=A0ABR1T2E1_9PEZI